MNAKHKLIILNDDPDLVEMMSAILEDAGYEVVATVIRDLEAVIAAQPEVVLLDCPPGEEKMVLGFAQRMRLTPSIQHVPILLATSSLRHIQPELMRDKHILVLVRPYGADDLLQAVQTLITEARERRPPT